MHTDDESEIECTVAKRVASFTIESDSQAEGSIPREFERMKRKRKIVKRRTLCDDMDIDVFTSGSNVTTKSRMDWNGICSTSELSSSDTCSSDGREADDEQSDWVESSNNDENFHVPQTSAKQQFLLKPCIALGALQRKLERFIRDQGQREIIVRHWVNFRQIFEVLRMSEERHLFGRRRLTLKVEFETALTDTFTTDSFVNLVDEAISVILGKAAPCYSFGPFDEISHKGSVVVETRDIHLIWAALSIYGRFFDKPVALHLLSNRMDIFFLVSCFTFVVIFIYGLLLILVYISLPRKEPLIFKGKHALITGGSKGIGKAIALAFIERDCSVSLLARDEDQLKQTCNELNAFAKSKQNNAVARYYSIDVTLPYEVLESVVKKAENELGDINILVNNVGLAVQGTFDSLDISLFEQQMRLNFLSAVFFCGFVCEIVHLTKTVVSKMKIARSGHIIFVNSAAGRCPVWGYTAYGATKFALQGFANALHMELLPYHVQVLSIYPPNTNTEGYQREMLSMPKELQEISASAGLFEPKAVAEHLMYDLSFGNSNTYVGLEGCVLGDLSAGGGPEKSFMRALTQVLFAGLFRAAMLIYIGKFNRIVMQSKLK
ncbi:unnamed protein product [Thelazia callipaeda]|uniref:17-beta-estradiol 17-dehydrogenase n=1 Tax=Thelazia callipaeda TaxID=103827 RepID=A0A0N5CWT0_THECL|nr:unnamed protein product [Thelazia callipaeda]